MPDLKAFLAGGGEMGERIRARDWVSTPLGPIRCYVVANDAGLANASAQQLCAGA